MSEQSTTPGHYSFRDVFEVLASARSFEDVLDVILTTSLRELHADQGSLLLLQGDEEHAQGHLKMLAARGLPEEIVKRGYVGRKGSISEYVLRERRPLILNDTPRTRNYESMADETSTPRKIRSAMCVPLIARGNVIGTMNLNRTGNSDRKQFAEEEMEVCSILAGQAAIVIENRRLHDELLQKERLAAVGQTVSGISHCIKNILAGVKGGLGITQMGLDQDNDDLMRQGFDLLKRNTGILGNLVLDLLDYSKEREPMRDTFDVARMLRDVTQTLEFKAETLNVRLEFKTLAPQLSFHGDADQILRAVLNLVTNAVERPQVNTTRPPAEALSNCPRGFSPARAQASPRRTLKRPWNGWKFAWKTTAAEYRSMSATKSGSCFTAPRGPVAPASGCQRREK